MGEIGPAGQTPILAQKGLADRADLRSSAFNMSRKRRSFAAMPFDDRLTEIKRLAVIAIFSDDDLFERLVLKGGNALDLVHHVSTRASIDLDFSMEHAFAPGELGDVRSRVEHRLQQTFRPAAYEVFDVTLEERPERVTPDVADFWGGYVLKFKLIDAAKYAELGGDLESVRRGAVPVGPRNRKGFEIDISKFEYCAGKQSAELDGFTIYVYTPAMLVCEKLRAICQQMPEYALGVRKHEAPRARDFLDIHDTITRFDLDLTTPPNLDLLRQMFAANRVPRQLHDRIAEQREFHRQDWPAVQETVRPDVRLKDFDFYFDFVVALCRRSEPLGHE